MPDKNSLKKYLAGLSKEDLAKEVEKLHTKFKNVQEYYAMELSGDTGNFLKKYKEMLLKEYFPNTKYTVGKARASVARKIISDFSKSKAFEVDLIDLMLYRVELCVAFTDAYGDINEQFYTSTENAFDAVVKLIVKNKFQEMFMQRCREVVNKTSDFGWGFHDTLSEIFYQNFEK